MRSKYYFGFSAYHVSLSSKTQICCVKPALLCQHVTAEREIYRLYLSDMLPFGTQEKNLRYNSTLLENMRSIKCTPFFNTELLFSKLKSKRGDIISNQPWPNIPISVFWPMAGGKLRAVLFTVFISLPHPELMHCGGHNLGTRQLKLNI